MEPVLTNQDPEAKEPLSSRPFLRNAVWMFPLSDIRVWKARGHGEASDVIQVCLQSNV